jgi:hypothetical protein
MTLHGAGCRMARVLSKDNASKTQARGRARDCCAIAQRVVERYQRAGDVASAVILSEGTCLGIEDVPESCRPDVRWFLNRIDTLEAVLDRPERIAVCTPPETVHTP